MKHDKTQLAGTGRYSFPGLHRRIGLSGLRRICHHYVAGVLVTDPHTDRTTPDTQQQSDSQPTEPVDAFRIQAGVRTLASNLEGLRGLMPCSADGDTVHGRQSKPVVASSTV